MNAQNTAAVTWAWKQAEAAKKRMNEAKAVWMETEANWAWQVWQDAEDAWMSARTRADQVVANVMA